MVTPHVRAALRPTDRALRWSYLALSLLGRRVQSGVLRGAFDWIHRRPDPWSCESNPYERKRLSAVLQAPGAGPFHNCLEVGCSEGVFTGMLARDPRIGRITALDVSPRAVARARARTQGVDRVQVREGDLLAGDLGGCYDLVFCMEVLYYLGAARSRVAPRLAGALTPGGRLVLAHPDPEAKALHEPFVASPDLRLVSRTVVPDPTRPVEICVLERA